MCSSITSLGAHTATDDVLITRHVDLHGAPLTFSTTLASRRDVVALDLSRFHASLDLSVRPHEVQVVDERHLLAEMTYPGELEFCCTTRANDSKIIYCTLTPFWLLDFFFLLKPRRDWARPCITLRNPFDNVPVRLALCSLNAAVTSCDNNTSRVGRWVSLANCVDIITQSSCSV